MTRIAPDWLDDRAIRRLFRALGAEGATPRFVGGCVRNALLGEGAGPTDIDLAIDVGPEETTRLLNAARINAVPTGFAHGTVTAVLDKRGFEITSLRRDVETDGRRARVAYTDDWLEDAKRRDFTMNALYADLDGAVLDPTGEGLTDLANGDLRFIGRAEDRIREDYLRILRFFRFHAWFGRNAMDPAGLAACERLAGGIDSLAKERIGAEFRKLLTARDPTQALAAMAETGVLRHVVPDARPETLIKLIATETAEGLPPDWLRRLAALDGDGMVEQLRLSKAQGRALRDIAIATEEEKPAIAAHQFGAEIALAGALIRAARRDETPDMPALSAAIELGAAAVFPLTARDLLQRGAEPGPALGAALKQAKRLWRESGFELDRDALLAALEAAA